MREYHKVRKFVNPNPKRVNKPRRSEDRFDRRDSDRSESRFDRRDSDRPERSFSREDSGRRDSNRSEGGFGRRDSDRSSSKDSGFKLHQAVCDKCGRECDIPFKPTGNKPIYCRGCFRENNSGGGNDSSRDFNRDRVTEPASSNNSSFQLEQINRKLDKIMKALKIN